MPSEQKMLSELIIFLNRTGQQIEGGKDETRHLSQLRSMDELQRDDDGINYDHKTFLISLLSSSLNSSKVLMF
jgi:hypothetical protein